MTDTKATKTTTTMTATTTIYPIHDETIVALRQAGERECDRHLVALCDRALDRLGPDNHARDDATTDALLVTPDAARVELARTLAARRAKWAESVGF